MYKITVCLLSFTLTWTPVCSAYTPSPAEPSNAELFGNANVRVIHVSPEEYPAIEAELSTHGYHQASERILLSSQNVAAEVEIRGTAYQAGANSQDGCNDGDQHVEIRGDVSIGVRTQDNDAQRERPNNEGLGNGRTRNDRPPHDRTRDDKGQNDRAQNGNAQKGAHVETSGRFPSGSSSSGGGSGRDAAIVLVVIGAFVLIVWTFYLFKYLYDLSEGIPPCSRWSDFMISTSAIAGDSKHSAVFSGLRYTGGVRNGSTDIGISAEVGYADILLTEAESLKLQGGYWLIGPILRWRLNGNVNPDYFQMDFMAGSTQNPEMGLLAQARAGLSFGMGEHFRWGVNLGAMNLNLHDNEGIITDRHQYHYIMGLDMGYQF